MPQQPGAGRTDQPRVALADTATAMDRSMLVLQYLVAVIAIMAALALTFLR